MKRKFRVVEITLPVYVPEKIAKGNRDELADYLTFNLYNKPQFFDAIIADDLTVTEKTIKENFDV